MLITKGNVKKASKKLLSLLLSVLMIMSTVSVCFGTISFAAYDEDPIDYLAEHLKHPVVQYMSDNYNYTYSGNAGNSNNITLTTNITLPTWEYYVEARDLLIYLEKAIKSCKEWDYPTKYTDDMQARTCTSAGLIEAQILGSLGNVSAAAKEFISFVLEDSRATQHSSANTSQNKVPANHTATVTISTSDIKGYLNSVDGDYTAVESGFDVSYQYVFKMTRGYYQVSKSSGISKTSYYHNYVKGADNTNHPVVNGTNTTIKTTVNNYVKNLDAKIAAYPFETLALMTNDSLTTVLNEVYALRTSIKNEVNSDSYPNNYSKLFPNEDAKITEFEANVAKARELASYTPTANAIKAYQDAHSVYGTYCWGEGKFEEATIKADYADFVNTYRTVLEDATLYEFFTDNGVFSAGWIDNFHDNVVSYDLEDTKELADALYNEYAIAHPDLGDEEPAELTLGEKQVVYGTLTGYIDSYNTYTNQVKNRVFVGGIDYLLNLQEHFQCQVDDSIIYFAENVNKDYTDVSTEKVIEEVATAKNQLAALNALKSSVDFTENLALLDGPFANANTFIAYLYSLLADRFTAQVDAADDMFTSLGRPNKDLTIAQYSKLNSLVNGIQRDIVTFIDGEGKAALITTATRNKLAALDAELMPAFTAFELDRGFQTFSKNENTITREDDPDEFFRENENLDDDMLGEYEVTDENVNAIVDLLEAALKDETVKKILGDLINKDEDGNPTGEAFSLSGLITGLLEDSVFTDELLNTIVQFLYPLVLKEFAKVWAGLPETINVTVEEVAAGQDADVLCGLSLIDVESAIEGVGLALGPQSLARMLEKNATWKTAYADVISALKEVQIKPSYNKENDSFRDPWADEVLFEDVIDEKTGEPVINEETGEVKQAYKMSWGINEAADKRKAFVDAAVAALSGVEPLLLALLTNKDFSNDTTGVAPRGFKIGTAAGSAKVTILFTLTFVVNVEPITLTLTFDKNDGWDNVLCPIFEALGLTGLKHSEDLQSVRKFLENGLLPVIDQLVAKLDAHPLQFILDALPNLCYMIDSGMIMPLLNELKTVINYFADAQYVTSGGFSSSGTLEAAMKSEEPINIILGDMLKDTLPDLSSFSAIWNLLSGVELLAGVEAPDAAYISSLGTLIEKDTNRSTKVYTGGTAGKAYYIQANRADVLEYLVTWVLGSGLLNGIVKEPSELVMGIFDSLANNPEQAVAAIVELLNQQAYPAKEYNWLTAEDTDKVGQSAMDIYLNPGNDWNEEKAQFLYENLDSILSTVLEMAGADFNLGTTISGAIDGLLTDKTLTALAALLAKLDLNALLAGDAEEADGEETPDANEPETAAEEGEEAAAPALDLDINALVKSYLGLDLAAVAAKYADIAAAKEADPEYVYNFGVDAGTTTFAAELAKMLEPLSDVLAFILDGGNLEITIGEEKATLLGANGYNNAIIPLLEALGCTIETEGTSLEKTINALLARIDALTTGDVIKNIIDMLPGVLYFISSNGLATAVQNLLQPVLVIVDTIRPVFDVMDLINGLEIGEEGAKQTLPEFLGVEKLNLKTLDWSFIMPLVKNLTGLDLESLANLIYDVSAELAVDYTSASTLIGKNGKTAAYNKEFTGGDMLTVVLSFVLEWATVKENAEALDEMLGTNGIVAGLGKVFDDLEITYNTPNWAYFFKNEAAFEAYLSNREELPITLAAIDWENIGDNDWDKYAAAYFAKNIAELADIVIAMVTKDEDATVATFLNDLIAGYINAGTINDLLGLLNGILANVDDTLLEAGMLLDVDLVGLKNYTCEKEITTISEFVAELAYILDEFAKPLVDFLFFGDDIRLAKSSDGTDTVVINGGLGYEKGLALILEALGCKLPAAEEATTANVLGALATRVEAILKNPVNEVLDLLPNLVYFLNANGAGVAVSNILAPVYGILDKLTVFGLNVDINELLGIDLGNLSLENVVTIVEDATGLPLDAAEAILVDFCTGKITKAEFGYKMAAAREDVITILLVVALELIYDDAFAAKLGEMLGTDIVANLKGIFEASDIEYADVDWDYKTNGKYGDYLVKYPETNNWTKDTAYYVADVLVSDEFDALIAGLIDSNYKSLGDLLTDKVNVFTSANLQAIVDMITGLLGGIDSGLLEVANVLIDVDLNGLMKYTAPADIDTVEEFAAELANVLNKYAKGAIEWLLLGRDFKLVKAGTNEDYITINGAYGYANGLALLLEALGCEKLPATGTTEEIVSGVLASLAARISEIFADPVEEVIDLLPNLIYFLNANGVAAVVDNVLAAVTALLDKLAVLGIELDINALVDLKSILGLPETAKLSLDDLSMAAVLEAVSILVGLDITEFEKVLVGFDLGEVAAYESVSDAEAVGVAKKMSYSDFAKGDMLTVVLNLALITLVDEDNAEFIKGLVGDKVYETILNVFDIDSVDMLEMSWVTTEEGLYSAKEPVNGEPGFKYGAIYSETNAEYIADNITEFADNVVGLLGLEAGGEKAETLGELLNGLVGDTIYKSSNVVAIQNAIAGLIANIDTLEVNGVKVGGYITEILKNAKLVDLKAFEAVKVAEFKDGDKEAFINELCKVLAPLNTVLKFILAGEDISFFVDTKGANLITLEGAEGYANGVALLLEALCGYENVLDLDEYHAAIDADDNAVIKEIIKPVLDKVDVILANPAEEILSVLTSLIFFINSNGIDVVVKNTLNSVYAILAAIEPIAKIDLYALIGIDFSTLDFDGILELVFEMLEKNGYSFELADFDAIANLTVGVVEKYTSANGKDAYRMVYRSDDGEMYGDEAEMVTSVERLILTFVANEGNQKMLVDLLKNELGMSEQGADTLGDMFNIIGDCAVNTDIGMEMALAATYYVFYGVDTGVDSTIEGMGKLDDAFNGLLDLVEDVNPDSYDLLIKIFGKIDPDGDIVKPGTENEDGTTTQGGIAQNGVVKFFQKVSTWFSNIGTWFKNLFSFDFLKR